MESQEYIFLKYHGVKYCEELTKHIGWDYFYNPKDGSLHSENSQCGSLICLYTLKQFTSLVRLKEVYDRKFKKYGEY